MSALLAETSWELTTLSAVLGSSIGSAVVSHWLTSRRSELEFRRRKLEDLWLAVDRYCTKTTTSSVPFSDVFSGKLGFNEAQELQIAQLQRGVDLEPFKILQMVSRVYFPHLVPKVDAVVTAVFSVGRVINEVRRAHGQGEPLDRFAHVFHATMLAVDAAKDALMDAMAETARSRRLLLGGGRSSAHSMQPPSESAVKTH